MRGSNLLTVLVVSTGLSASPTVAWANNGIGAQATVGVGFAYALAVLILVITGSLPRPPCALSGPRLLGVFVWTPLLVLAASAFQFGGTVFLIPILLTLLVGRLSWFAVCWGQARAVGRAPYEGSRSPGRGALQILGGLLVLAVIPLSLLLLGVGSRDVWVESFQGRTGPRALWLLADVQDRAFAETGAYLDADEPGLRSVLAHVESLEGFGHGPEWAPEISLDPVTPGYRILLRSTHRAPPLLSWYYSDHPLTIAMDETGTTRLAPILDASWEELQVVGSLDELGTWFLDRKIGD